MKLNATFYAFLLFIAAACSSRSDRPEITWSLMHPTHLDTVYMAKVIANLPGHPVDNFEVCGGCNSFNDGSLDGLLYFEEYPLAAACLVTVNGKETAVNIDGGATVQADASPEGYVVKCGKPEGKNYPMVAVVAQII